MLDDANRILSLIRSWAAYAAMPAIGIITAPMLAHALGPEGRGQLAGMLQPIVLAGAIAALGVPSAVTYFIGGGRDPRRVTQIAVRISILMTLIVAAGLYLYSGTVARQIGVDRGLMLLVWLAFLPSAFISIRRAHLQGLRNYRALDLERVIASGLRFGQIVLLCLAGISDVRIYAVAYMAAGLTASCVLRVPKRAGLPWPTDYKVAMRAGEIARYALLASFGTIASAMSSRLDQAIMPAVVPVVELGYFSVAVAVAEVSTIISSVAVRNVLAETSTGIGRWAIVWSVLIGGAGQVILVGAMLLASPYVVPIIFGRDFAPAVDLIRILLLGTFIAYWGGCASAFLAGLGRPGLASMGPAAGALCTALLFWMRWHNMDAMAASWISVTSQIVTVTTGAISILWLVRRRPVKLEAAADTPSIPH